MTKDCIRDCIDAWRQWDGGKNYHTVDWSSRLTDAGYPHVDAGAHAMPQWPNLHAWCREQFGERHYAWTGTRFWFETEQDAVLFALTWG